MTLKAFCKLLSEIMGKPISFRRWADCFAAIKPILEADKLKPSTSYSFDFSGFTGVVDFDKRTVAVTYAAQFRFNFRDEVPGTKFEFYYEGPDGTSEVVTVKGDFRNYAAHTFELPDTPGIYWVHCEGYRLPTKRERKYGTDWRHMNSGKRKVRIA